MYNFRNPFYSQSTFSNRKYYTTYYNQPKFQNNFNRNIYHNNSNTYTNSYSNNSTATHTYEKTPESIPPISNENSNDEQSSRGIFDENNNQELFEIFGLKIYFDDVLIICILLFLYQEGVKDEYLFISLILLLLN